MGGNLKSRHHSFFRNKRTIAVLGLTTVLLTAFQNCSELKSSTDLLSGGGTDQQAGTTPVTGGTGDTTTGGTGGGTDPVIGADQRRKLCHDIMGSTAPSLTGDLVSEYSLNFGASAGFMNVSIAGKINFSADGNAGSAPFSLTLNRNFSTAQQNDYVKNECGNNTISQYQVEFELVTNDSAAPINISGVDASGNNRITGSNASQIAASKAQLALDSIRLNNNNNNSFTLMVNQNIANNSYAFNNTVFNTRYSSGDNDNPRSQKCVSGSFYLNYFARVTKVSGNNNNNNDPSFISSKRRVKINVTNNCPVVTRLLGSPAKVNALLGSEVAISGDWAVGLSEKESVSSDKLNTGAVYLYKRDTSGAWSQKTKIQINELATDELIRSVGLFQNTLVIGVPKRNNDTGAIWFYRLSGETWNLVSSINSPSGFASGLFGRSISINANYIAVGSPVDNKVYVYTYDNAGMTLYSTIDATTYTTTVGEVTSTLLADFASGSRFGWSLALNGSNLFVGAPGSNTSSTSRKGAVHQFSLDTSAASHVRSFAGKKVGERFGTRVSSVGTRLGIYSAFFTTDAVDNPSPRNFGRFEIYPNFADSSLKFEWARFEPYPENIGDHGIVVTNNGVLVSYSGNSSNADRGQPETDSGSVFYIKFQGSGATTTLSQPKRIRPLFEPARSRFGWSMAVDGNRAVIGSRGFNNGPLNNGLTDQGAIYITDLQ